ncbi:LytR/AlgR family response regulator transcription factor [Rasiella sp. SM2506]|uniref:LytR/AlgR family response regulator transcription factor n=1 Tax=Rasiella sp. SM2506 TaxID=3423914 RepID=UPI003D79A48F
MKMKQHSVLIIDDEPMAREVIERHLSKMEGYTIVASCKNAAEGFSALHSHTVDLIFLDINMPEVTGLMFAKAIGNKATIIFTTAYREYAVEGFEMNVLDYLVKPISLERFAMALQKFQELKAVENTQESYDFTFFRCDRKMVKIDFETLLYVESFGDYIKLHTVQKTYVTRETMKNVLTKLPSAKFLRVHRSSVVAISKIESYTNELVILNNNAIAISRGYREMVQERLENI